MQQIYGLFGGDVSDPGGPAHLLIEEGDRSQRIEIVQTIPAPEKPLNKHPAIRQAHDAQFAE